MAFQSFLVSRSLPALLQQIFGDWHVIWSESVLQDGCLLRHSGLWKFLAWRCLRWLHGLSFESWVFRLSRHSALVHIIPVAGPTGCHLKLVPWQDSAIHLLDPGMIPPTSPKFKHKIQEKIMGTLVVCCSTRGDGQGCLETTLSYRML